MTDLGTQLPQQWDFSSSPDLSGVPGPSLQKQPALVGELNPNTLEKRILQTAARTLSTSFCFRRPENLHSTRLHRHTHTSGRAGAPCPCHLASGITQLSTALLPAAWSCTGQG